MNISPIAKEKDARGNEPKKNNNCARVKPKQDYNCAGAEPKKHNAEYELVYMGSPQYGIRIPSAPLSAIEKACSSAGRLALGLLELIINKEECSSLSIYGQSKGKVPMDVNKRKALRSHVFNRYNIGSEAEKDRLWTQEIVTKLNDKIRAIKNN
ncbi:uncharacterized protein LOC132730040 [Ruditapes philippinarum]|uniref:uncharacterized protein LOC132730040 n=1 Tax=Ruditapes philippinarum TaxID=129788 RepID=UPI00295B7A2C|nr:uncharacterized protein LOC132730040 [Ruditapes philippinarum]